MTIAERKEREREERRMQIITAAERLFFENGYDQVSMEQIARDAELSKGTIFVYFKNKEALYLTIVLQGIRLFHQMISEAVQECEGPAIRRLCTLGMCGIRFAREYPGYRSLILLFKSGRFSFEDRETTDPEVAEIIAHSDAIIRAMEELVRSGVEDGTIRNDIDPVELAIIIRMMISCVMDKNPEFLWSLQRSGIDEELLISHYMDLVETVIRGPGNESKGV
ncbi:MAG TPA: TetR/AcrR family transcriptional regulator [Methanospirillum sp.]|nr:TetR/AcrR family transcriptional regulator [Methanospirillum sp.]